MAKLKHKCEQCDSEFVISYSEEVCETDPIHCPFCASYLLDVDAYDESDDGDDD